MRDAMRRARGVLTVCLALLLTGPMLSPAAASDVRTLAWDDLVPELAPLPDPLAEVPMAVRFDLGFAAQVLRDARDGRISEQGPEYLNALGTLDRLKATGVETAPLVEALLARDAEIAARGRLTEASLDGVEVRLPGYALPLEMGANGMTELLLVPYVGACIHVPPPPPNQIVYGQLSEPYEVNGLYEPVWIIGKLSASASRPALNYVDGAAEIATGYRMEAARVEPYE